MTSAELPGVAPDVLVVGAGNAALCAVPALKVSCIIVFIMPT